MTDSEFHLNVISVELQLFFSIYKVALPVTLEGEGLSGMF